MSRAHYREGIPSVTELLAANGYYDQYPDDPYYLKRGNWAHKVCDILAQGGEPDIEGSLAIIQQNNPKWDLSGWLGFPAAYRSWMRQQSKFRFVKCQVYVLSKSMGYQGTLDQLIVLGGSLTLVEIKSVTSGGCPKATALQTAGYQIALPEKVKVRLGLALHSDGTYLECPYRDYRDLAAFRLMVGWYHMQKDYR